MNKQETMNKIILGTRTLLLVLFLFAEFFSFGFLSKALAACTYDYTVSFDTNPKSVAANGKVTFTTDVQVRGTTKDVGGNTIACVDASRPVTKVAVQYFVSDTNSGVGSTNVTDQILLNLDATSYSTKDVRDFDLLNNLFLPDGRVKNIGLPVTFPVTRYFRVRVYEYNTVTSTFGTNSSVGSNKTTSGQVQVSVTEPVSSAPPSNLGGGAGGPGSNLGPGAGGPGSNLDTPPQNTSSIDCKTNPNSCLYNPLPTDELTTIFLWIARGMLGIAATWSVIFIIVGGFRMVMSQGNEEAYGVAKKTVTWAVLGLLIALLSFSIVAIVTNLIGADVRQIQTGKPSQ